MQSRKLITSLSLLAISLGLSLSISPKFLLASAGASKIYIASESTINNDEINSGDFIVDGNVNASKGKMYLNGNSSILSTGYIKNLNDYGCKDCLHSSFDVCLESNENNNYFAVTFGLENIRSDYRSDGTVEFGFKVIDNKIYASVTSYYSSSVESKTYESSYLDDIQYNKTFNLSFDYSCDRHLNAYINDIKIIDNKFLAGIPGDGYFSCYTSGLNNKVAISHLSIYTYSYQVIENVEYKETFDNYDGYSYNSNVFYSSSSQSVLSPSYLAVKKDEETNNKYLHFCNTADAYISTQYQYSNFQLDFDLLDLSREAKMDDSGTYLNYISQWFGIGFGLSSVREVVDCRTSKWFQFEGMRDEISSIEVNPFPRYVFFDTGFSALRVEGQKDYLWLWDPSYEGEVFNIRFQMVDGVAKIWIKNNKIEAFPIEPLLFADYGSTPLGYVRLFTWGERTSSYLGSTYNGVCNMKIDNLSIMNLDYIGVRKVTTVTDNPSGIPSTLDFDYVDPSDSNDLLINKFVNGKYKQNNLVLPLILSISGVVICIAVISFIVIKKKKGRNTKDE